MISEIVRGTPHPSVVTLLAEHKDLWLSSIVVHELEYGVRRLPQGQRRTHLQASLLRLTTEYEDRILPLDRAGAEWAAQFRAQAQHAGFTLDLGDALIAGTAKPMTWPSPPATPRTLSTLPWRSSILGNPRSHCHASCVGRVASVGGR